MSDIDIVKLYNDHGIRWTTSGIHAQEGWIQTACPFCGDSTHDKLGFNIGDQYFNCWKCGYHATIEVLTELLSVSILDAKEIMNDYTLRPSVAAKYRQRENIVQARPTELVVPGDPMLDEMHINYLSKRGYDPWELMRLWGLRGTGTIGDYKYRIICPIWHDGKIVSYQGRDVSGASDKLHSKVLRWKTCRQADELREHKHCLGGVQLVRGTRIAIVEGFTDAWKLGPGAVCTFGTAYLAAQVMLMRNYDTRFHIMDSREKDPNAQEVAQKLANTLSAFRGEDVLIELDHGDPGDLTREEAKNLMKELGIR